MTDLNERALKPCPFCGKAAQIAPDEIGSGGQHVPPYHAGCFRGAGCGIAFTADDPDEAIEEWNRRALISATPPDVAGLIEELADEADLCRNETATDIADLLDRAATALRLSAGGGWRDIASAPKDGTEVLVYAPPYAGLGDIICKAAWHDDAGWCVDELRTVTHWQPLPLPPASPTVEAGHVE